MPTIDDTTLLQPVKGDTTAKRFVSHIAVLVMLPWVLLAVDESWMYSPPGSIDPWLYHGFMRLYPEFIGSLFPSTYYGTRLGWLLPGYAVYATLPPVAANLVLHLAFYYLAVGSAYIAAFRLLGQTNALLGAIIIGTNPAIVAALGWDYVDGAVIAYALAAVAAALHAASRPSRDGWLLVCGAALAAMVHTNLVAAILAPAPVVAFVMTSTAPTRFRAGGIVTIAAGGLLATAAMGAVNVGAGGSFAFFLPSIQWALAAGAPTHVIARFEFPAVLRLLVPLTALVAVLVVLARRRLTPPERVAAAMLAWVIGAVCTLDALGAALLATQYYANWLVPFACLALSTHILGTRRLPPAFVWAAAAIFVISGAIGVCGTSPGMVSFGRETSWLPWPLWAVMAGGLIALTAICAAQRARILGLLMSWIVCFATAAALAAHSMTFRPDRNGRDLFEAIDQVINVVRTGDPAERPLFWYGPSPLRAYFDSIASTHLFLYSIVGFDYPSLPDDLRQSGRNGATLVPPARVAVLSDGPVDAATVRRAFAQQGLDSRIHSTHAIVTRAVRFELTLIAVTEDGPSRSEKDPRD